MTCHLSTVVVRLRGGAQALARVRGTLNPESVTPKPRRGEMKDRVYNLQGSQRLWFGQFWLWLFRDVRKTPEKLPARHAQWEALVILTRVHISAARMVHDTLALWSTRSHSI